MKFTFILIVVFLASFSNAQLKGTYLEKRSKKVYKTTEIKNQIWMAENLAVQHFRNGDIIPQVKSAAELEQASEKGQPAWCYYTLGDYVPYAFEKYNIPVNSETKEVFGIYYNRYAVNDPRGLAPEGWRIATISDWSTLVINIGAGAEVSRDGNFYKHSGLKKSTSSLRVHKNISKLRNQSGWAKERSGDNDTYFSALPGGYVEDGNPYNRTIIDFGAWWCFNENWDSTLVPGDNAWAIIIKPDNVIEVEDIYHNTKKHFALPVRCIRDDEYFEPINRNDFLNELLSNLILSEELIESELNQLDSEKSELERKIKKVTKKNKKLEKLLFNQKLIKEEFENKLKKLKNIQIDRSRIETKILSLNSRNNYYTYEYFDSKKTVGVRCDWMATNLCTDVFRNGDSIPMVSSGKDWMKAYKNKQPAWCHALVKDPEKNFNDKTEKIYNWYAINDPRGLAPYGWEVPTYWDWEILANHLGGFNLAGKKMKLEDGWPENKSSKTNMNIKQSGLNVEPVSLRYTDSYFYSFDCGSFWSRTGVRGKDSLKWFYQIPSQDDTLRKLSLHAGTGASVRCIRKTTTQTLIGSNLWSTKNLNVTTFRNGDSIPEAKTKQQWINASKNKTPAWCYYNNLPDNGGNSFCDGRKYGKLYNWYAVNDPRGIAPEGWRVASARDWMNLKENRSFSEDDLKSEFGYTDYNYGTNKSGFNAHPGYFRDDQGKFRDGLNINHKKITTFWWTSSEFNLPGQPEGYKPKSYIVGNESIESAYFSDLFDYRRGGLDYDRFCFKKPKGFGFSIRIVKEGDF